MRRSWAISARSGSGMRHYYTADHGMTARRHAIYKGTSRFHALWKRQIPHSSAIPKALSGNLFLGAPWVTRLR